MSDDVKERILIYPPGHPYLITIYILIAIIVSMTASSTLAAIIADFGGFKYIIAAYIVAYLIFLSPILSFINIVITTLRTGYVEKVLELEYATIFGIPVPIPRVRLVERKSLLALNVGGGLVPILASIIIMAVLWKGAGTYGVMVTLLAIFATSGVTFLTSKTIPGVGIAVPALIPPLASALTVMLVTNGGPVAALSAYVGGSLGSLIGADVLRFTKDLDKLVAPVISIGGAGVFDGVFLSGIIAAFLVY